ncbi:hypothetical protein [Lonsdalea quercina]|uniref:hypothetical protein n=1 Tax=Lonsdalea quercina TaxID=71657 RepID=UPI003976CAFE
MKKILSTTLGVLVLSGCIQMPKYEAPKPVTLPAFPFSEYENLKLAGNEKLSGQVFLKTVGGDVKVGAGNPVILLPKTSYTDFQYRLYLTGVRREKEDSRAAKYEKLTTADATGSFEFDGLSPGQYYVTSLVSWMRPSQFGLLPEGGEVMSPVTVSQGKKNTVMLTK